jgi:hypothetical protein
MPRDDVNRSPAAILLVSVAAFLCGIGAVVVVVVLAGSVL